MRALKVMPAAISFFVVFIIGSFMFF